MVRRAYHSAPLSLAVITAMFAFGAHAEDPQAPLPFEQFHASEAAAAAAAHGDAAPDGQAEPAPDGHAAAGPDDHSPSAPEEHQAEADGMAGHAPAGHDGEADNPATETVGVKAPYSEAGEDSGFPLAEHMEALEPYKLVRSLQVVQDSVVRGDHSAMEMQRFLIGVIDARLREADQEVFDDPRNVDAALIYAMSGGNPATLEILAIRDKFGNFDNEVTTVLRAYLNGRAAKTKTTLAEVVEIYRDTEIGPYITLVAANVSASLNDGAALELFDWARLTAPGTLVEEAALRRSLYIAAQKNMVEEAVKYAQLYARRFISSPYAGQYANLVVDLVLLHYDKVGEQGLSDILSFMDRPRKREVYLRIARKAAITGQRDLAVFAADKAESLLTPSDKRPQALAELYSGMARIPTDGVGSVLESINAVPERRLSKRDRALREAAQHLASEVIKAPVPDSFTQELYSNMTKLDPMQGGDKLGAPATVEKKAGKPIFKPLKGKDEAERAAEEEVFKGYVSDRKQTLERIDKLLEGAEEDKAS